MESLSKLSWNVMERIPTTLWPMPLSTNVAHWAANGYNVEITSTCACMHQNLTWLDKTHAFMLWEGFKAREYMSCPHNLWLDRPCFHQRSSCNLIVIIRHSHQWNICRNSLEMSWNIFQQSHHQYHYPPMSHVEQWMGPTLKFLHFNKGFMLISTYKCVRSLYYSSTPILLLLCPYIRIVILGMSAGVL